MSNLFRHATGNILRQSTKGSNKVHFYQRHSSRHALLESKQIYLSFPELPLYYHVNQDEMMHAVKGLTWPLR